MKSQMQSSELYPIEEFIIDSFSRESATLFEENQTLDGQRRIFERLKKEKKFFREICEKWFKQYIHASIAEGGSYIQCHENFPETALRVYGELVHGDPEHKTVRDKLRLWLKNNETCQALRDYFDPNLRFEGDSLNQRG